MDYTFLDIFLFFLAIPIMVVLFMLPFIFEFVPRSVKNPNKKISKKKHVILSIFYILGTLFLVTIPYLFAIYVLNIPSNDLYNALMDIIFYPVRLILIYAILNFLYSIYLFITLKPNCKKFLGRAILWFLFTFLFYSIINFRISDGPI